MSPLERSQRSGTPLEPDKPVTVNYSFEDGERREVRVTAAEADDLLRQGVTTTSRWSRAWRATWGRVKPAALSLTVLIAGAVLGGYISDRYADRQRELELEASLITQISAGAIKHFQKAQEATRATANPKQRDQRDRAADDWVLLAGSITPVFRTYFGGQDAAAHWDRYQAAMYDWAVIGCCTTNQGRPETLARIRKYVETEGIRRPTLDRRVADPWTALDSAEPPPEVYQWLGLYLLRGRGKILDDLTAASPELD